MPTKYAVGRGANLRFLAGDLVLRGMTASFGRSQARALPAMPVKIPPQMIVVIRMV